MLQGSPPVRIAILAARRGPGKGEGGQDGPRRVRRNKYFPMMRRVSLRGEYYAVLRSRVVIIIIIG